MIRVTLAAVALLALLPSSAGAAVCADGVWRAGCVGPNGAVVVHKPTYYHPYYRQHQIRCSDGIYRRVCTGTRYG